MHLLEFGGGKSQLTSQIMAREVIGHIPSANFADVLQVRAFRLIKGHIAMSPVC
jgi:hypothetical protein